MLDTLRDLLTGGACVGCARPGRPLCPGCARGLPVAARVAWPTPAPAGLAPPVAAGDYTGLLRALVLAHKERGALALAGPLGRVLAVAAAGAAPGPGTLLLVPVPSRRAVVRARGHDPLLRVARHAAAVLRAQGRAAAVRPLLVPALAVRDQAGLDAAGRAANLAGSLRARPGACARVPHGARVVVVDDVITTGSTAREAQRALEEDERFPLVVQGIAVVAATRRRAAPDRLPATPANCPTKSAPSLPLSRIAD